MADTATVTLKGALKTTGGTPLSSQPITFSDDKGDAIPGAMTDANGDFTVTAQVAAPAPGETFTASFAGVPGSYGSSSGTAKADIVAGTAITLTITVQ